MSDDKDVPAEDLNQQPEVTPDQEADEPQDPPNPETPETPETTEVPEKVEPIKREVHMMPVSKVKAEKEKAAEKARTETDAVWQTKFDAQAKEHATQMQNSKPPEDNAELAKWAEDNEMNLDAAKGLLNIVHKSLPKVDTSAYDNIVEEKKLDAQRTQVKKQINEGVVDIIKKEHPSATPQQISNAIERITELAFTAEYNTYPVEHIYMVAKGSLDFDHGHSGEGGSEGTPEMVSFDNITPEDEEKMSPEEYGKYSNYKASKGSRYKD